MAIIPSAFVQTTALYPSRALSARALSEIAGIAESGNFVYDHLTGGWP